MAKPIRLTRLEVWSDLECAGGERLAFELECLAAEDSRAVGADEELVVRIPVDGQGREAVEQHRVLRAHLSDGTWQEWRIAITRDHRDEGGGVYTEVRGESPLLDLVNTDEVIGRTEANGAVNHDFGLYGLSPSALVEFILGWAPAYFSAGDVEPAGVVDLTFSWSSPLDALRQLAELTDAELAIERDGVAGYQIHLKEPPSELTPAGYLRYRRNLHGVVRHRDLEPLVTRVYPRGAAEDGFHADMSEAAWEVVAAAGDAITLEAGVVAVEGQLDGLWAQDVATGHLTPIFSSGADQVLALADAGPIGAGSLVQVRASAAGAALTHLDNPVAAAQYLPAGRHRARVIDRPEIPWINNLASGAFADESGDFVALGAASLSREASTLYHRYGDASVSVNAAAGEGVETPWVAIHPTAASPYFSAQVAFWIQSGAVRLELVAQTAEGAELVFPDGGAVARSSVTGTWTENLAVGGIDLFEVGAVRAKLRLLAHNAGALFYLDAVQLVQRAGPAQAFYDGRSACDLWREANRELLDHAEVEETYDVRVHDLYRIDPEAFAADRLDLGEVVTVDDAELGISVFARTVEIRRDLLVPGAVELRLSNRIPGLTGQLTGSRRRGRSGRPATPPTDAALQPFGILQGSVDPEGAVTGTFAGNELAQSFGWRASTTAPVAADADTPEGLTIVDARSGSFPVPDLVATAEQPVYLVGWFFPQPGGQGTPGPRVMTPALSPTTTGPMDPAHPLADGRYIATLDDLLREASKAVAIAQAFVFSADVQKGTMGTEIEAILTQPIYDSEGLVEILDTRFRELKSIAFGANVTDSEAREVNRMLAKPLAGLPDDARGITYGDGLTVDSLQPNQAGSDVTGLNTALDTANVAGATANVVASGADRANQGLESNGEVAPGKVADEAALGDFLFASGAAIERVFAQEVFSVNTFSYLVGADTVVTRNLSADKIAAKDLLVENLAAIVAVLGEITAGILFNTNRLSNPTAAIRVSPDYSMPASVVRYIDIALAGAGHSLPYFIYHPALKVPKEASFGPATFAGALEAATGLFLGDLALRSALANVLSFQDGDGDEYAILHAQAFAGGSGGTVQIAFNAGGSIVFDAGAIDATGLMLSKSRRVVTAVRSASRPSSPHDGLLWVS